MSLKIYLYYSHTYKKYLRWLKTDRKKPFNTWVQIMETLGRIKDQAINLCKNEAAKKGKESRGGNSFARKSNLCNLAQIITFTLLAEKARKSNMIKVPVRMKGGV